MSNEMTREDVKKAVAFWLESTYARDGEDEVEWRGKHALEAFEQLPEVKAHRAACPKAEFTDPENNLTPESSAALRAHQEVLIALRSDLGFPCGGAWVSRRHPGA